jgi:hypothetical protein
LQIKNKEKKSNFDLNDELDYEEDEEHGEKINVKFIFGYFLYKFC